MMNMKVCIVLLGVCIAMIAGSPINRGALRKQIMKRLNERMLADNNIEHGLHKQRMFGAKKQHTRTNDRFAQLREVLDNFEEQYGEGAADNLLNSFSDLIETVVSATSDGEMTAAADSTTESNNDGTTESYNDGTTESNTEGTTDSPADFTTGGTTNSTTTEAAETTTEPSSGAERHLLRLLLKEINLKRKK